MINVDVCRGRKIESGVKVEQIRPLLAEGKVTLWIDIGAPTEDDWKTLTEQFDFHPLALEDARNRNRRAKVDQYPGYLFLSVRSWIGFQTDMDDMEQVTDEIDIFLGPTYLVTIHQKECSVVAETIRRWEQHPDLISDQPGFLLHELLDTIVDDFFPAIDDLDVEIDKLETLIYSGAGSFDVKPALRMKKRLLLLRQTIAPMRDLLNFLLRADQALIPVEARIYLQDVYDHSLRQVEQVDLHRDMLTGVLDAMMAQTSNRLNQVMKTMTAVSTILMSASLITGVYGMNFVNMPELRAHNGYYGALAAMAGVALVLTAFFKRIKWF